MDKQKLAIRNSRRVTLSEKEFDIVCRERESLQKRSAVPVTNSMAFRSLFARAINGGH